MKFEVFYLHQFFIQFLFSIDKKIKVMRLYCKSSCENLLKFKYKVELIIRNLYGATLTVFQVNDP